MYSGKRKHDRHHQKQQKRKKTETLRSFKIRCKKGKAHDIICAPKLEEHPHFPGLSKKLQIQKNKEHGRFISANGVIHFKEKVADSFACVAVIDHSKYVYCLTCLGEIEKDKSFVCKMCKQVWFCSSKCDTENTTHTLECGSTYHTETFGVNIARKVAIQMLLKAIWLNGCTIDKLIEEEAKTQRGQYKKGIPSSEDNEFDLMMRLQEKEDYDGFEQDLDETFTIFWRLERIKELCKEGKGHKDFLRILLGRFLKIAFINTFETELVRGVRMSRLFLNSSFFNHSCSPNVLNFLEGPRMYCIASRRINEGEHLEIDYLGFSAAELDTNERRRLLENSWGFLCQCNRCTYEKNLIEQAKKDSSEEIEGILSRDSDWTPEIGACIIAYQKRLTKSLGAN